jgi:hypothetical protein
MTPPCNPNARRKTLGMPENNPRASGSNHRNLNAEEIVPVWAGRGQDAPIQAYLADGSSVMYTDGGAAAACFTKKSLCEWLQISTRTWDRLTATGQTPAPDLLIGREGRWMFSTVAKWLRSKPRLTGRQKGR